MNNFRTLTGLLATGVFACAFQVQAAVTTTVLDGANSAMGVTTSGCLQSLLTSVSDGENCMYSGGPSVFEWPPNSGTNPADPFAESIGPTNDVQYYDFGTTVGQDAYNNADSYAPFSGDGKIRRVINGSITVDDQNNSDETDDLIGFTFTITSPLGGDIVRLSSTGWADRYTSMTQVLTPRTADFTSATVNEFGGFDYVIGTAGFPLLLTFTDPSADETAPGADDGQCVGQTFGDMECGAGFDTNLPPPVSDPDPIRWTFYDDGSMPPLTICMDPNNDTSPLCWRPTDATTWFFGAIPTPPGQFDAPHLGPPGSPGLGTQENNIGARTSGAVVWDGSPTQDVICNDKDGGVALKGDCQTSKESFNPLLNGPNEVGGKIAEDPDWDQVYLKISTDARGNVLTAEGFDVQETMVFDGSVLCGSDSGAVAIACNAWNAGHFTIAGVVAVADTAETALDTAVNIDVLANDIGFVDPVSVSLPGAGSSVNGGTVLINGTNPGPRSGITISFTPLAGIPGAGIDTFEYTIDDGTNSGTATVTIDVLLGANDDIATTRLNTTVNIPVGANDGGFADPATYTITVPPDMGGSVGIFNGSPGPAPSVTIDFTPNAAPGTATYTETFTYEVDDGVLPPETAIVTVTVTNELPIAVAATETVAAGTKVTTDVATLPGINLGDAPSVIIATGSTSVAGTVITYTAGLLPGSDSYDYTITDVDGETSTATVDVTVTGGGGVPGVPQGVKANPDEATVLQGESVDINVTLNDQPGSGVLADHTVAVTTAPTNGSTSVDDETNVVTYTPNQGFNGFDSFNYTLRDVDENISITSVTVTVKQFVKLPSASSAIGPWSLALLLLAPWLRRRRT